MEPGSDNPGEKRLVELLATAVQRLEEGGRTGLEAFLGEHPQDAEILRKRLHLLASTGMLEGDENAGPGAVPGRLGEFRLLQRLGSGGMGVVYLADQPSLKRRVAVKLIRPEHLYFPQARERFRREVEAAARLQHPGIVRVYSAGEEGGLPYFTMERVEGVSLDRLLEELRPIAPRRLGHEELIGALARLRGADAEPGGAIAGRRSWVEICLHWTEELAEAVGYAHRQGVLHRDIKPSNVMITWSGRAMLLDFGLASTGESARITRTGSRLGSLPYMAPEQVRGEHGAIDERTDVYGLGVTLYEMLTLASPFQEQGSSDEEVRQKILRARPEAPRQRNPAVSWDAETVCLSAMAPERSRRYPSAAAMARDLRNVLELRPIAARRPSPAIRLRRFVRRHPAWSVAACMGFLLLVVTPTVVAVREYRLRTEISRAVEEARLENDIRRETLTFLNDDLLSAVAPDEVGKDASMRQVLDVASQRIESRFPNRPLVEAAIRGTLGQTYRKLGLLDEAERHLERALELYRSHAGAESRATLDAERKLAALYAAQDRKPEAIELLRRNLATCRTAFGAQDPDTLATANNLGLELAWERQFAEAEDLLKEVVETRLRILGEEHEHTQASMSNLGLVYYNQGKYREAEPWMRRELELCRRTHGPEHPGTLISLNNWANLQAVLGRPEQAMATMEEVVALSKKVRGEGHYLTINSMVGLASFYTFFERYAEAEQVCRAALEAGAGLGEGHSVLIHVRIRLAESLHLQHRLDEAEKEIDRALTAIDEGETSRRMADKARFVRGKILNAQARYEEAAAYLAGAIERYGEGETPRLADLRMTATYALLELGRFEEVEKHLELAEAAYRESSPFHHGIGAALEQRVRLYEAWSKPEEAAAWRQRLADWQAEREQYAVGK